MPQKVEGKQRVHLTPERIIATGLELAARPGVKAISVRDLGEALGADSTAIYRHFRSKDDLMRALLDHVAGAAANEVDADSWDNRLRQLAARTIDWFLRYPAIGVEAVVLTTHGPGENSGIELIFTALRDAGLADDEIVRYYALLASLLLSSASGMARAKAAGDDDGTWLDGPLVVDPTKFPLLAEHGAQLNELRDLDVLMSGIEMIIESVERSAQAGA